MIHSKLWTYVVFIVIICLSFLHYHVLAQDSSNGIDVAWEFNDGLEGWGQATSNEMQADIYQMGDELWIDIKGPDESYIDSPKMNMSIGREQTVAIRYRYVGKSRFGKLRLEGQIGNGALSEDEGAVDLHFALIGDSKWRIGYIPLKSDEDFGEPLLINSISQMRLWPGIRRISSKKWKQSEAPQSGDAFQIDWVRLVRVPIINRITGCNGLKLATDKNFQNINYKIGESVLSKINGVLAQHRTIWKRETNEYPYASSYNCLRGGGENITIEGHNFGTGGANQYGAPAHVFIDGKPCSFVKHDPDAPQERLTCITPPLRPEYSMDLDIQGFRPSTIQVKNGLLPGLVGTSTHLAYASYPQRPVNVSLSNFASRSIDISWVPGGNHWQQMTCTGFVLKWRKTSSVVWQHSTVVGNVTTTTIRGLSSNTSYIFCVAALNENQSDSSWWDNLDLYGRRKVLEDALEGPITETRGRTLMADVNFQKFDANGTQNHGAALDQTSIGPTGISGGEGHYGLVLVGSASIANCNSSSFCCDDYNDKHGRCLDEATMTCLSPGPSYHPFDENTDTMVVAKLSTYSQADRVLFNSQCGASLRLTPSEARARGAAFYPRQLEVSEGFDSNFTFEISNPSFRCNNMDAIYTNCRSRGGDGLAFVIQADRFDAKGSPGLGLGYDGINNSIAIEFDTYHNPENSDPYENHISIHTRGWQEPNSSNHTYSLGHTNAVQSLTDGRLNIRVTYELITSVDRFSRLQDFVATPYTLPFVESHGLSDTGFGIISIYCENLDTPVLSIPLNLRKTLDLNAGRAWVGFTAATGVETFQAHDVLSWQFTSLRMNG